MVQIANMRIAFLMVTVVVLSKAVIVSSSPGRDLWMILLDIYCRMRYSLSRRRNGMNCPKYLKLQDMLAENKDA